VIHRDLKPSNILVDQSGQPKEAETARTSALALFSDQSSDATLPSRRAILAALIELYAAQGRPEAEEYRARLVAAGR
jgi:serine/threonine protein kinase